MIYLTSNLNDSFRPVTIYYKSKESDTFHESTGCTVFPPECNILTVGFGFHHYEHKMDTHFINKLIKLTIGIIYICDELPWNAVRHENIVYIKTGFNWFTHMLIRNPQVFKAVFHNNTSYAKKYAEAFSQFQGYKLPILKNAEEIKKIKVISKQIIGSKKILIETFDGLGDILMSLPTAYTFHKQGWEVDYYVALNKKEIFENLDFVNKVYTRKEKIPIYAYNKHFILTHKLSTYGLAFNQQHRIYSSAYLCGLANKELEIKKPIITLSDKEKEYANTILKGHKNTVGICWFAYGTNRSYFRDSVQQLIDMMNIKRLGAPKFTPVLLGTEKFPFQGAIDLTGQTTLRQLFALINKLDYIITVDTGVLHIAGAFDKPTLALMGPIPAEWRCSTYKKCTSLTPKIPCYPCWDKQSVEPKKRKCNIIESFCLRTMNSKILYKELVRLARKYQ